MPKSRISLEDLCVCANCHARADIDALDQDIPDLSQRIEAGGPVPAGECPSCGALMYMVQSPYLKDAADLMRQAAAFLDGKGLNDHDRVQLAQKLRFEAAQLFVRDEAELARIR